MICHDSNQISIYGKYVMLRKRIFVLRKYSLGLQGASSLTSAFFSLCLEIERPQKGPELKACMFGVMAIQVSWVSHLIVKSACLLTTILCVGLGKNVRERISPVTLNGFESIDQFDAYGFHSILLKCP